MKHCPTCTCVTPVNASANDLRALGITARSANCLWRSGWTTPEMVESDQSWRTRWIRNFGAVSIRDVSNALARKNGEPVEVVPDCPGEATQMDASDIVKRSYYGDTVALPCPECNKNVWASRNTLRIPKHRAQWEE